jgi:hypothetical protein
VLKDSFDLIVVGRRDLVFWNLDGSRLKVFELKWLSLRFKECDVEDGM